MATGPIEDRLPNNCLMLLNNGELRAGTGKKYIPTTCAFRILQKRFLQH